jgi:hypothetical protein
MQVNPEGLALVGPGDDNDLFGDECVRLRRGIRAAARRPTVHRAPVAKTAVERTTSVDTNRLRRLRRCGRVATFLTAIFVDKPLRGVSSERRRCIRKALRQPAALPNPEDAALVVALARRMRRLFIFSTSWRARLLHAGITALVVWELWDIATVGSALAWTVAAAFVALEVAALVQRPRVVQRMAEAERLNVQVLESFGHPLPVERPRRRWYSNGYALASLAALPLSFAVLPVVIPIEDPSSHARLVLVSALVVLLCGGTSLLGVLAGLKGRAEARAGAPGATAATIGTVLSALGLLLWLTLGVAVVASEW